MATATEAEIAALENQIYELNQKLVALQKANPGVKVPDDTFATLPGEAMRRVFLQRQGSAARNPLSD